MPVTLVAGLADENSKPKRPRGDYLFLCDDNYQTVCSRKPLSMVVLMPVLYVVSAIRPRLSQLKMARASDPPTRTSIILALIFLCFPFRALGQTRDTRDLSLPAELTPADSEIRTLLRVEDDSCNALDPTGWTDKIYKALQIAETRGLVGDKALIEASLASTLVAQGKLDQAFMLFRKSLQDSIDSRKEVLEADILISLASEAQVKGNTQEAVDLVTRALSLSEKTGNLYGKARGLGELGKLKLIQGKQDEASRFIDEALSIDRLNGYKFEALHLVYRGSLLGVTGHDDQATESMKQARAKALTAKDSYSFVSAENSYAFGLTRKGRADEAVRQMDLLIAGNLDEFVQDAKQRTCLAASLEFPVLRLVLLEGFANVLEGANRKEREIGVWEQIFSLGEKEGILAAQAEAKQKAADLENQLKRSDQAVKDYAAAADLYRKLGNDTLLDQVQVAESVLLVNLHRGEEAVPMVSEINSYARQHSLRELEFRSFITLAGIFYTAGEVSKARDTLESAVLLVRPGPFDEQIDNTTVHGVYVSLADIYRALGVPPAELISIDCAFFVSAHLKDEKAQQHELGYLDQRLSDLHVRERVEQLQKEGRLTESLIFSYVLYLRDGHPEKAVENPNWQRILTLPFQITQTPRGAVELAQVLNELGPLLGPEKLPMLNALAWYYITAGADPILAEKYAAESEDIAKLYGGVHGTVGVASSCVLAIAYSREGKNAAARDKSTECLNFAQQTHDDQTISYAEATNAMVQAQTGNLAGTKDSLEKLVAKEPQNTELHVELAIALASAKLYGEAKSQLESAVRKLLSAGDKKAAAGAYSRAAFVLGSDPLDAAKKLRRKYLNAARNLYHDLGTEAVEAGVLILIGDDFLAAEQTKAAILSYRRAQELAQKSNQRNIVGQALFGLGNAYQAERSFSQAADLHERAAQTFRQEKNSTGETISLRNLGRDAHELGDSDKALTSLLEARKAAANTGTLNRYLAAYFLGDFYRSQGQYEKALASFREALEITTGDGDLEHSAYSHLALASLDGLVGNWEDALSESETALKLFENIGNRNGQASCWAELTGIYSDRTSSLKDFQKAQDAYKKAENLGYGKTLQLDLMEIYLQTGEYARAVTILKDDIHDCLTVRDDNCRAHALISLSEAERLRGNLKASRSALNDAGPVVSKSSELYLHGRLLYQQARLLASEGKPNEALQTYQQLISLLENVRGKLDPTEQKSISENYGFIYDEMVSLLFSMSKNKPSEQFASEALVYAEKNKARQFSESWGRVFKKQMRLALPAATQEREQALYAQRDRLLAKLDTATTSNDATGKQAKAELERELASMQAQIRAFAQDLRKTSPQYAAIAYPDDVTISTLPLRKGETLVEFKMTDDATFAWIVQNLGGTQNELAAFYEIPQKRTWFLERVSSVRTAFNSGHPDAADWKICEELFAALFPPDVKNLVVSSPEIIFVPDDVLFVLPFEIFSPSAPKGEFPFLNKATTYYPSAVSLSIARTAKPSANWQSAFLGIADPITSPEDERFEVAQALKGLEKNVATQEQQGGASNRDKLKSRGFSFERLPGTAAEVQTIASLLRSRKEPAEVRLGVDATKAELLDTDLSQFRFLHFATHGVLPVDTGIQEPSLVLSYDGTRPESMFLSMSEILNLKLQSDSVVLSACNTGSGKISRAEGVMSLGRAFLAAGASSVTVSLWQVSDESTALLMENYYKALLEGKKKSVALAAARHAVFASGTKNPFFWAPFIEIGE